ncbi:MAG: GTPase domain-containing protein [Deltaproteobacteria bacterium]|nr:MAG: GTPase domain-containing protein [Deltaproteobacteria bacterium]
MSFVNVKKKEVQIKIVYYGPGRGGKTTNLEYIYKKMNTNVGTEMVSIKTRGDRTIFFDYLPFDMGKVRGYDVKVQLYTVPGQVKYNATKEVVLKGVDGVVFVADSMEVREEKNLLSLQNLKDNLATHNKDIFKIPLVIQYNKRDLEEKGIPLISLETLQKSLNSQLKVPALAASALRGTNVVTTLGKIISMTMVSIKQKLK